MIVSDDDVQHFLLSEIFLHHLNFCQPGTLLQYLFFFLLLKVPCFFRNDEMYGVKDFFNFHAHCVNAESKYHAA